MNTFFFGESEGPTPGDMGIEGNESQTPKPEAGRPTPQDIDDRVANLEFQKKRVPNQFRQTVSEIEDFANGEGDQNLREEYYAGWTQEDFQQLLSRVGQGSGRNEQWGKGRMSGEEED
jgi:hypothetical protein